MNLDQIQTTEDDECKNPNLFCTRFPGGCIFGEMDDEHNNVLYEGEILHAPDTNELIIGEAWVYDND